MSEEAEETQFRYMLEFPNKIKVYCADERLFSNLLERYCAVISSTRAVPTRNLSEPAKQKEPSSTVSLPITSRCPECGSNRVTVDDERRDVICVDCGYLFYPQKQANNSQDVRLARAKSLYREEF
jgi:ribosomal protein S27E